MVAMVAMVDGHGGARGGGGRGGDGGARDDRRRRRQQRQQQQRYRIHSSRDIAARFANFQRQAAARAVTLPPSRSVPLPCRTPASSLLRAPCI